MSLEIDLADRPTEALVTDKQLAFQEFRNELLEAGLLVDAGELGLYLRSLQFENICQGIDMLVRRSSVDEIAASYQFPLVTARGVLEKSDYVRSFPNLVGSISGFGGAEDRHGELLAALDDGREWADIFQPIPLVLSSAACHPLYRTQTGRMPEGGRVFELIGACFRHEPSMDPARMQVFRQHEFVYIGDPQGALRHRDTWVELGCTIHSRLGLEVEAVVANDPFFGRSGKMLVTSQLSAALKIELVSPICSIEEPTAITSANYHLDHFGSAFAIESADGAVAHSACVGFGVERIALALLRTHGLDIAGWPESVRSDLGL